MQISLEENETHAIQSYSDTQVMINHIIHEQNLVINQENLITPWSLPSKPSVDDMQLLLDLKPEIIIIGHALPTQLHLPASISTALAGLRIGIECMPLGAACRTYNILLSEKRAVVLGVLFHQDNHL